MEAAADLIVHASAGHLRQGEIGHILGLYDARALPVAQREIPVHGLGKRGGGSHAALSRVELARQRLVGREEDAVCKERRRAPETFALAYLLEELLARLHHFAAPRPVGLGHALERSE